MEADRMSSLDSDIWDLLKATPARVEELVARLAFPNISKNLFAGIDTDGYRHFLIPLLDGEECLEDSRSRGIRVSCEELKIKSQGQSSKASKYMDIICQDAAGFEVFDVIGQEIATYLESSGISKSEAVSSVLAKWRYFWGKPVSSILSYNEIIGLFSELWYLYKWTMPYVDLIESVNGWRGPYASRHDFEWPRRSIEVKGTTSVQGRIHWINGIDQLLPPEKGELYFFSLKVREEGGAINTLTDLIADCRKSLKGNPEALANFENTLVLTGYSPLHDDEYNKIHLRVVDELLYIVKDKFPRITTDKFQGGIPSGVEAVQYQINLEGYDTLIIARKPSKNLFGPSKKSK